MHCLSENVCVFFYPKVVCDVVNIYMYIDASSAFSTEIWTDPDIDSKRTMNGYESFQRCFRGTIYQSHPALFEFLDTYKSVFN